MKPRLSLLMLTLLACVGSLSEGVIRACDQCDRHPNSASGCDCASAAPSCDDQGILDHSAKFLDSIHRKSKRALRRYAEARRSKSCDSCVTSTCSCDERPSFEHENLLSRLFAKKKTSACDTTPDCGCETCTPEPVCGTEIVSCDSNLKSSSPDCGGLLGKLFAARKQNNCDNGCAVECQSCASAEADCGAEIIAQQSCDSSAACDEAGSPGGLLGKLLAKGKSECCDTGCSSCVECQPAPARIPDCGVEQSCDCAAPSCDGASCGGLLGKFLARHQASSCGPCGDVRSGKRIDFENMFRPSCKPPGPNFIERMLSKHRRVGCDAGCDNDSTCACHASSQPVYSQPSHDHAIHPHVHDHQPGHVETDPLSAPPAPSSSIPTMTEPRRSTTSENPPQPVTRSPGNAKAPAQSEAAGQPAPAPTPPTRVPPRLKTQPQPIRKAPVPDSQLDPFRDDAARRIRKLPAEPIRYQRNVKPAEAPKKPHYGDTFDSQANNVRVSFSDYAASEPERIELTSGRAIPMNSLSHSQSSRTSPGSDSVRAIPAKAQAAIGTRQVDTPPATMHKPSNIFRRR